MAASGPQKADSHAMLTFALGRMIGTTVQVQTTNGSVYRGIFHGSDVASHEIGVALSMAYKCEPDDAGTAPFQGKQPTPNRETVIERLTIAGKDVAQISAVGVDLGWVEAPPPSTGAAGEYDRFTDSGILGGPSSVSPQRELTPWSSDGPALELDLDVAGTSSSNGGWDAEEMFRRNEAEHGIKNTFSEDQYTTTLDKSHPEYAKRMAHAERLAREITKSGPTPDEGAPDASEEDMFSAVSRPAASGNSYVPPHMRAKNPVVQGSDAGSKQNNTKQPPAPDNKSPSPQELKQFSQTFKLAPTSKETKEQKPAADGGAAQTPATQKEEPAKAVEQPPASTPTSMSQTPPEAEPERKDEKKDEKKPFVFRVSAAEFTPGAASSSAPPPTTMAPPPTTTMAHMQQSPVLYPGMPPNMHHQLPPMQHPAHNMPPHSHMHPHQLPQQQQPPMSPMQQQHGPPHMVPMPMHMMQEFHPPPDMPMYLPPYVQQQQHMMMMQQQQFPPMLRPYLPPQHFQQHPQHQHHQPPH